MEWNEVGMGMMWTAGAVDMEQRWHGLKWTWDKESRVKWKWNEVGLE